jgi:hypothetical protein
MIPQEVLGLYACVWSIGESTLVATCVLITYRLWKGKIDADSECGRKLKGIRDATGLLALTAILFLVLPIM